MSFREVFSMSWQDQMYLTKVTGHADRIPTTLLLTVIISSIFIGLGVH